MEETWWPKSETSKDAPQSPATFATFPKHPQTRQRKNNNRNSQTLCVFTSAHQIPSISCKTIKTMKIEGHLKWWLLEKPWNVLIRLLLLAHIYFEKYHEHGDFINFYSVLKTGPGRFPQQPNFLQGESPMGEVSQLLHSRPSGRQRSGPPAERGDERGGHLSPPLSSGIPFASLSAFSPCLDQALFLVSVRSCSRSRALRAPLRSRIPAAPAPCQRHRRDRRARTATERDGFSPLGSIISKFLVVPSRISHANARTRSRGSPGKEMRHCGMISISVTIKNAVWVLLLHPTPTPKSGLILLSPRLASHPLKKK